MHTARVFRHIAADGASYLARRIWRVIQTQMRNGFADRQITHATLHGGGACNGVDIQNFVELG